MASERDPIPCPVCREVIIGPLSAAVHLSDMHGLSMYGALARLTAELDAAREREREFREVLVNVRDALIVLSDDTWDLTVAKPRKKDSDTLYAWTVGHYRRMREADAMLDRALASTPPDTEGQP